MKSFTCNILISLAISANAWVFSTEALKRAASIATASAIIGSSPLVSHAVDFSGAYADPFHPNCLRVVSVNGPSAATLKGTDGNPGCPVDGSGKQWQLTGTVDGNNIFVDFSPKGGPKDLKGEWDVNGIKWPDGNKWEKKAAN